MATTAGADVFHDWSLMATTSGPANVVVGNPEVVCRPRMCACLDKLTEQASVSSDTSQQSMLDQQL